MENQFSFIAGENGSWEIQTINNIAGHNLPIAKRLNIVNKSVTDLSSEDVWILRGFTSNTRYAERHEIEQLKSIQPVLSRVEASCAAMIAIKKNAVWWDLAQDERRAIFENQSHHNAIGMDYLPAIARKLHHSRDLGEPFDFITWFEFPPEHLSTFDHLLTRLRATTEWQYIEREVEVRLKRLD